MNRLIRVIYICSFIFICQFENAFADQWLYINPLKPDEHLSIETNPDAIGMYGIQEQAKYCKQDNEFICINSVEFQFYVPRNSLWLGKTWSIGDVKYQVTSKKKVMLFGIKDVIYYIDQYGRDHILKFLYSTSRGLVGIGGVSEKSSAIFLVDVKCGYGASSKCSE